MSLDNKVVDLADLKVSHDYLLGQDELLSDRIDELGSGIDGVESIIGDLSNLSTTLKNNIVSAINEVLQTGGRVKSVNGKTDDVVLKTSDLTNDSGYLTSYTETDPTVPSWAKQQQKPSYTASEVGAATTEALTTEITTRTASDAQLQSQITALGNGAPIPVETVAEMIDNTKAYLYTGAEAGWLTGYWYTYDSTQAKFVPRGEYGVGTVIDDTLTVTGDAADAKATGDAISEVRAQIPGVDASLATAGKAADAKATGDALTTVNGRLDQYEDELGLNPKIEASVTTGDANVKVTLLDGLDLDLATSYIFTFRIPEAINTAVYIPIYRDTENLLVTLEIPIGQTEKVYNYTTHSTVPFADGKVQVKVNRANVHVDMTIEYASAPPSRLDNLETALNQNATEIEALSDMSEVAGKTIDFLNMSVNKLNPAALVRGKYISKAGVVGINTLLSYTGFIPVKPGDKVNVVNDGVCDSNSTFRICTAYDSTRTAIESAGKEYSWNYDVPDGVMFVVLSLYNTDIDGGKLAVNINGIPAYSEYGVTPTDITFEGKLTQDLGLDVVKTKVNGIDVSVNRLNPFTVTTGKYINMSGTIGNSASVLYTDYIKVNPGEMVYLVNDGVNDGTTRFRYLTAYDSEKVVIPASGKETSYRYDVPEGVAYIILTLYAADYAGGKLSVNINGVFPYSAYNDASANMNYLSRLIKQPYTTLPQYILDNAWYKPLGPLEKGYFCFMTDDGRMGLTEYTIPMVIDKGIKCSFALMSDSEVMQNQSDIDIVLNAISHGCEVAQHGGVDWTTFSEYGLNKFFDDEKAFFDSVGIDLHGAVIPGSYNSKLIFALAGARFGVLRGGGSGHGFPLGPYYQYHTAGARSNLYGLSGYNIIDQSLATSKAAVDYAIANNKIMIVYTHENELGTSQKATLEGLLDYVIETGITQVTLGDIPNLI